jgi:hypothetical protein
MTEFKKGDRVVHTNFESGEGTVTTGPTRGPVGLVVDVQWDEPARHLLSNPNRHQVSLLRHVPAPLDPSKVKAGDTVTVENGTTTVTGKVGTQGASGVPTALFMHGVGTLYFRDGWTLIAHQPAPEPEPEWTDGTVAEVTYNNADETEQFKTRALRGDGSWVPFADVSDLIMDDEVTDVRPLVVIDPAEVDVDAIIRVAKDFYQFNPKADGVSPVEVGVRYVLEHLGLNR